MALLDEIAAENTGTATLEGPGKLLDRLAIESRGIDLPEEAEERDKILNDVLEMSDEFEIPIQTTEAHYKQLTEKPERRVPVGGLELRAAPTPTKWEAFKKFFVGDRAPLPPDADRIEKVARAFDVAMTGPLRAFFKLGQGMTLGAPDLMWGAIKRITPDEVWADEVKKMTLEEAMDWAGGYNPSGFQKSVGEVAEFVGRLRTVAPIAKHLGIIGETPKDISVLGKAAESAKLFGTAAIGEQTAKLAAAVIDPSEAEYGFEGPKAVLRDMAIGAVFSLASQGVKAGARTVWAKLTPTEQARALKTLGLKKGATDAEINQAARDLARTYHPDKVKGFEEEFKKVIEARGVLRRGETTDVVFRGAKVTVKPKLLPAQAEAALAKLPAEHPPGREKIDAIVARIKESGETKQMSRIEKQRFDADIAALDAEVEAIQKGVSAEKAAQIAAAEKVTLEKAKAPTGVEPSKEPGGVERPGKPAVPAVQPEPGVIPVATRDAAAVREGLVDSFQGQYERGLVPEFGKVAEEGVKWVPDQRGLEEVLTDLEVTSSRAEELQKEISEAKTETEIAPLWDMMSANHKVLMTHIPQLKRLLAADPEELTRVKEEIERSIESNTAMLEGFRRRLEGNKTSRDEARVKVLQTVLASDKRRYGHLDAIEKEIERAAEAQPQPQPKAQPPAEAAVEGEAKTTIIHAGKQSGELIDAKNEVNDLVIQHADERGWTVEDINTGGEGAVTRYMTLRAGEKTIRVRISDHDRPAGLQAFPAPHVDFVLHRGKNKIRLKRLDKFLPNLRVVPFTAGDRVQHPVFGSGIITEYIDAGKKSTATVDFDTGETRNIATEFTGAPKLTKLAQPPAAPEVAAEDKVKKPKGPKDITLTAGFDPGLKEFVAQSLKPAVINASESVKATAKIVAAIPNYSAEVFLQPSLELERKSPEAYVAVMKAVHTATDAARLKFEQMPLEALDLNISQARKYFAKNFTKDQQYDFLVAFAGQPGSPDAAQIQKAAFDRLPEEMRDPKQVQAMRELAQKNYDYLKKVVGPNVNQVPDYFYGVFENRDAVDRFWSHWTSTDRFTKKKTIPSVADAIMFGLESGKPIELRAKNFIDNLMNEYLGIAKLDGMKKLKVELMKVGSAGTKKTPPAEKIKPKKAKNKVEQRAGKLAEIYGSAQEALRLQQLQDKVSGKPLTQQAQATHDALKELAAKEKTLKAKGAEPPAPGGAKQSPLEEFDSLRARSEAEDPDINVIHPEDINFYITEDPEAAPANWETVADPVFRGAWLRPDLARLIDNLTATNKITQHGILNAVRTANNFTRSLTFFGSAFHLKTVTGAAIADSGWGGPLLSPKRALKPFRTWPSTKQWEKAKQTPEFKRLLGLGVGLGHSAEEAAATTMQQFADYLESKNVIGATGKLIEGLALRLPLAFQKWQFDVYIPMLKHAANMDQWALLEKRTGRPATDGELIDIIKATQNLFGEMNERLLGRSATQTTGSRFFFKAPGFAEGNVRTNIDAGIKFGGGEERYTRGRRARSQIVNSLVVKSLLATAGTLWLTGKLPKWVSDKEFQKEDFADIFKIDTGQVDGRGRRIMINTLDSDKDYLDLWFNMFVMRPDRALYKAFNRIGGMKSTLAEFVYDGVSSLMRQDIRDWKGDKVFSLSDTPQEKLWKYTEIALERLEPISKNVFDQMRFKEIGLVQSFLGAISGVRPTWSELDRRTSDFYRLIFEQKADLEVLDIEILSKADPRAAYEAYNKSVERILNSRYLPKGFKEQYGPELRRNVDEYLQNKAFAASHLATEGRSKAIADRSVRILKHFGITSAEATQLLRARKARLAAKPRERAHPLENKPIIGDMLKEKRLKQRLRAAEKE